ncbi:MAG TPA: histidine phosphatase family protein [Acidimicrobiales bacterium]
MTNARVLLLRHGESTWNAEGRWQGWADPPLSPRGERQALDAAAHLKDAGLTRVVSSDLVRARRTAEIVAAELGLGDVEVEPDLRERSVGEFQGHTTEEVLARWPECFDDARKIVRIPGGETFDAAAARAIPALLRIARRHEGETVLVATHGGIVRAIEAHLGVQRDTGMPNLGGRWLEVCAGGPITAGDMVVTVDADLVTRPASE